jgi:hypothetical protein
MGYGFFGRVIGNAVCFYAAMIGFAPIILSGPCNRFFKPGCCGRFWCCKATAQYGPRPCR